MVLATRHHQASAVANDVQMSTTRNGCTTAAVQAHHRGEQVLVEVTEGVVRNIIHVLSGTGGKPHEGARLSTAIHDVARDYRRAGDRDAG